jgi:uncharacterized membrane protein YhhN
MPAWTVPLAAALGLGHIAARYTGARALACVLKPLPIALLAALVASEPAPVAETYRWLVCAALLCSMAGDIWLLFPRGFVPGLASFLVAHLFYVAAFAPGGGWDARAWLLLVPFALAAGAMLTYLWPHLRRERGAVLAYVGVIAVMGWRAAVRALEVDAGASGPLAFVGALLFMVSDGVLATNRFARPFAAADAVVMVTYYAAQVLIALSVRGG